MTQYGLISETDGRTLERVVDLICENVEVDGVINVTEIGVYGGDTGFGITDYIASKNRNCFLTGVENYKDGEKVRINYDKLIIGNSNEVYNQLEDNSQHMIFVDGDHTFIGAISDFFAYAPKVKAGGYFCFHDTGRHIKPMKDFQHGDKNNPDAYISVRKALEKIGVLYSGMWKGNMFYHSWRGWQQVLDEADETNEAGGICVFKKMEREA